MSTLHPTSIACQPLARKAAMLSIASSQHIDWITSRSHHSVTVAQDRQTYISGGACNVQCLLVKLPLTPMDSHLTPTCPRPVGSVTEREQMSSQGPRRAADYTDLADQNALEPPPHGLRTGIYTPYDCRFAPIGVSLARHRRCPCYRNTLACFTYFQHCGDRVSEQRYRV